MVRLKKKAVVGMLLLSALSLTTFAGFEMTASYTDGMFSDVPQAEWYADEVKSTYQLGLMNGTGGSLFEPDGEISVAEAVTLCARVRSIYNGDPTLSNSTTGNWYDSYVRYAMDCGFVTDGQFDSFERSITRAEMATLFHDALPDGYYKRINNVSYIPDVDPNSDSYRKILNLYNAGIVMGNDSYGNFSPDSSIKRCEAAAIINRVALEENRVRRALTVEKPTEHPATAYYIDDIDSSSGHGRTLVSGWDYDDRSSFTNFNDTQTYQLSDIYTDGALCLKRDINPLTGGTFELQTSASVTTTTGGFYFLLTDDDGLDVIRLCGENGKYVIRSGDKTVETGIDITTGISFTIKGDLDAKRADLYFDGVVVSSFDITEKAKEITKYIVGTTEKDKVTLALGYVQLYSNFLVHDIFRNSENSHPSDWITNDSTTQVARTGGNRGGDVRSLQIKPTAGKLSYAKKYFEASSGKLIFETYIHTPKGVSGVYVAAKSGDTEGFRVVTNGNRFETADGSLLREYRDNVWQCIRLEADTASQTVLVRIDGKTVGEYPFDNAVTYFDNIEIGGTPSEDTVLSIDDVTVYTHHEYDDYVPEPVPAESKGYDIGIQVCSLWRNGYHSGWDTISNFPELEPYLGYYDEGNIEVADWEIKYLVEHGIDFQHFCWYCPSSDINEPIKSPSMFEALHDGYFNAKYSHMMKFNLMWENNGKNVNSLEQFQTYIWPYWLEYYFTDDRYMTVDNKILLTVWNYGNFISCFGGADGAKEAVAFMNDDLKKLGFDGIVILFHDGHNQSASVFQNMASAGVDGTYSYNLNVSGYSADYQINRHKTQRATGVFHNTASIGVGFNNVGWAGTRHPMITNEDFEKVARFMKDEYLKETEGDGTPWHSRLLFVSTWNEYGEGHYIMPTEKNGFGYLDVIRKVFTDADESTHNDIIPTEAQKARINQIYPKGRSIIDQLMLEEEAEKKYVSAGSLEINGDNFKDLFGHAEFAIENGVISGSCIGNDYGFQTAQTLNIDANVIKAVRVRAKLNCKPAFQVFFTTDSSTAWTGTHVATANVTKADEFVDLLFDFSEVSGWKGTVTGLRFDPANEPSAYEVTAVELLGIDASDRMKLVINTEEIDNLPFDPELDGENVMVAIKLGTGVLSRMSLYHEYSRFDKTFYLASKKHELLMTEGKNTATFDGKEITMPFTYTTRDGLPYVALNYIAELFECTSTVENGELSIVTVGSKYLEALKSRVPYEYEFNIPGMTEGWTPASTSLEFTENGTITGTATDYADRPTFHDPALGSPALNIPAAAYPTIEIRMKTDLPTDSTEKAVIYFKTATSGLSESRTVRIPINEPKKDDDGFAVYTFDMTSNAEWKGTIPSVRFDPFNCAGSFEIDYIRFIKDENAEIPPEALAENGVIVNGDAEAGTSYAFFNEGCDITVVEDPENKENHCYSVVNKSHGVKSWTYFRQKYQFEPGATYLIEFDVKIKGTNDGKTDVSNCYFNINLRYLDSEGKIDHFINVANIGTDDGWVHVRKEMTVSADTTDRTKDEWTVYSNPVGELGVDYYMDNIVVTKTSA